MFYGSSYQRQSFPELVGQYAQPAAGYVASLGLNPVLLTPFDAMTQDYLPNRVRIIYCPRRGTVMQVPVVG